MIKRLLCSTTQESTSFAEFTMSALRIFFGLAMAFGHGLGKIPPGERFLEGVAAMGFPMVPVFAWAAALSEFGGGLLVAFGLWTRLGALGIAFTMLVAAFIVHASDPFQTKELALLYFFLSLVFLARGSGKLSIDYWLSKKCRKGSSE